MPKEWICCQLGAREHYAVPRSLDKTNRLKRLYTDFWAGRGLQRLSEMIGPNSSDIVRHMFSRYHEDLKDDFVASRNAHTVYRELVDRCSSNRNAVDRLYRRHLEIGRSFAGHVRDSLRKSGLNFSESIYFAYDTGALETLEWLNERGVRSVVDQIDPSRVELELVRQEERRWPGWQKNATEAPDEYFQRRELEWGMADRVVVNSEFSKRALIRQGVPTEKLTVIPLCYESGEKQNRLHRRLDGRSPLRVLWLGQVILRKGIQYLIEAAHTLSTENVQFDVVGPVGLTADALALAPGNMRFYGKAGRDEIGKWYQQADIFVLPTVSDGFALTQLEAMSYGLPVITTKNCGEVVTHEVDGQIIPPGDAHSLALAIYRYLHNPELVQEHQIAAPRKANQFTTAQLSDSLIQLEQELLP